MGTFCTGLACIAFLGGVASNLVYAKENFKLNSSLLFEFWRGMA